jgi:DNA-binding transcriptional ArsR family regulator
MDIEGLIFNHMVNNTVVLDSVFYSLADPTRRDILDRLRLGKLNVGKIAEPYHMSLPAVSKHLKVLERAHLIRKQKEGKERIIELEPAVIARASEYLRRYEQLWNERFDFLEEMLQEEQNAHNVTGRNVTKGNKHGTN